MSFSRILNTEQIIQKESVEKSFEILYKKYQTAIKALDEAKKLEEKIIVLENENRELKKNIKLLENPFKLHKTKYFELGRPGKCAVRKKIGILFLLFFLNKLFLKVN